MAALKDERSFCPHGTGSVSANRRWLEKFRARCSAILCLYTAFLHSIRCSLPLSNVLRFGDEAYFSCFLGDSRWYNISATWLFLSGIPTMPACPKCHRPFKRQFCLNRHVNSHHGTKQHQCPRCHNMFARPDNLEKHLDKRVCRRAKRRQVEPDTASRSVQESRTLDNTVQLDVEQAEASNVISQASQEHLNPTTSVEPSGDRVVAGPSQTASDKTTQMPLNSEVAPSSQGWTHRYYDDGWTAPPEPSVSTLCHPYNS